MIIKVHAEITVEFRDFSRNRYFVQTDVEGCSYWECMTKSMGILWEKINSVLGGLKDSGREYAIVKIDITKP